MKKPLLTFLLTAFFSNYLFSQSDDQNYLFNMGIGYGINYGVVGTKMLIGLNNTGLIAGLGATAEGLPAFQVGGQISVGFLFLNAGYGVMKSSNDQTFSKPSENVNVFAGNVIVGIMLNLDPDKKTFIELSLGHTYAADKTQDFDVSHNNNNLIGNIGLNFRVIGRKKQN